MLKYQIIHVHVFVYMSRISHVFGYVKREVQRKSYIFMNHKGCIFMNHTVAC